MKVILSAFIGLSVLASVALPVLAADSEYDFPSNIFERMERQLP